MFRKVMYLGLIVCLTSTAAAEVAFFQGLGDLPGGTFSSSANAVSGDGSTVVGGSMSEDGNEAFRWTADGGIQGLGDLSGGSFSSVASSVSADGRNVAGISESALGMRAFRWTLGGSMTTLPSPDTAEAWDISGDGSIVVGSLTHAVAARWGPNGLEYLWGFSDGNGLFRAAFGVSSDGSVVVGFGTRNYEGRNYTEATRWTEGQGGMGLGFLTPGDSRESRAYDVSADGSTVVGESNSPSGSQAFRWTAGEGMVGLGDLPGDNFSSAANAVSADGSIVVGDSTSGLGREAFIWHQSIGMRSIQEILSTDFGLNLTGWSLSYASGISDDGKVVVGSGVGPNGNEAWMAYLPFIPEPPSQLGDMDFDGDKDFDDIDDFVLGLTNATEYFNIYGVSPDVRGDIDESGFQDFDDIPGFVAVIVGSDVDANLRGVPEPSTLSVAFIGALFWAAFGARHEVNQ